MNIIYKERRNYSNLEKEAIENINKICFSDVPLEDCELDFVDEEIGNYFLMIDEKIVGHIGIHLRESVFDKEEYLLGGIGGLSILPEYRGHSYGKELCLKALEKLKELKCDVACMCVTREHNAYKLYETLGYEFLNRDAYFIDAIDNKKSDDSVMILGINDRKLAQKILSSSIEFNYGSKKGYW